jgi:hypothetical protein
MNLGRPTGTRLSNGKILEESLTIQGSIKNIYKGILFMKYTFTITLALLLCLAATSQTLAEGGNRWAQAAYYRSQMYPWHGGYYEAAWGMPVALVVPPTAENQVKMHWGVGGTRVVPIDHQFKRDYPGEGYYDRAGFLPTPPWPSDTDQFGVYYVRGPW